MKAMVKTACLAALAAAGALGPAAAEIKVAVIGPMAGEYEVFGAQMTLGALEAIADINFAGGILGEDLVLEVVDDGCVPARAEAAARAVVESGATLVVGHFCSGASVAAAPVYAEAGIVMISPSTGTPAFTDQRAGEGIFRLYQRDDRQGVVAGSFLGANFADKAIAILDDGSAYGAGFADATAETMRAAGATEALRGTYAPGEADYADLVDALKAAGIEVVFVGGYHREVALIARAIAERGLDATLVSGDALVSDEFWAIAGDAATGTLMTFVPDPRRNPAAAEVLAEIEADGESGEGFVLYTYAAVQAWAAAAGGVGTTDFGPVATALAAGTYPTVLGDVSFDEKGDALLPGYVIYEWRDGGYEEYRAP